MDQPAPSRGDIRSPSKLVTIRKTSEVERTCREGRSLNSRLFVLIFRAGTEDRSRVAIKVSRKVGNAVVRNRIRRQIKEILRAIFPVLTRPCDLVVIARKGTPEADFSRKRDELHGLLARHGCLESKIHSKGSVQPGGSSGRSSRS